MTNKQSTTATTTPTTSGDQSNLDPSAAAILSQISGTGQTQQSPIGVQKGYVAQGGKVLDPNSLQYGEPQFTQGPVDPKYFEGDQFFPSSWSQPDILALQWKMKNAGLLTKSFRPGMWDQVSADAYELAMGYANRAGTDVDSVIQTYSAAPEQLPEQNATVLTLKSPDDIKNVLQSTAAKVIGRSLSDAETTMLVAGYQQLDRTAQEKQAAATELARQGTSSAPIIDAPDLSTYAQDQLRSKFKGESQFQTGLSRMNEFYSILGEGGGSGGASNG